MLHERVKQFQLLGSPRKRLRRMAVHRGRRRGIGSHQQLSEQTAVVGVVGGLCGEGVDGLRSKGVEVQRNGDFEELSTVTAFEDGLSLACRKQF